FIDLAQFLSTLESSIFSIHGFGPGDVLCARNMSSPQRSFVRIIRHMEALSGVFFGAADIHQWTSFFDLLQDIFPKSTNPGIITLRCYVIRRLELGYFTGKLATLFLPLQPPAIHYLGIGMSEELEHPESISCPPIVLVSVKHDGRLRSGA